MNGFRRLTLPNPELGASAPGLRRKAKAYVVAAGGRHLNFPVAEMAIAPTVRSHGLPILAGKDDGVLVLGSHDDSRRVVASSHGDVAEPALVVCLKPR